MLVGLLMGLLVAGMASMAQALLIDFTSTTWQNISGVTASRVIDGINVTLDTPTGNLTWNSEHGDISSSIGLAGIGDGIGVSDDEISLNQALTVSFSHDIIINEIYFLDLFKSNSEYEHAQYMLENDVWTNVDGTTNPYGFISITTGSTSFVSWVQFETNDSTSISDFAVAGLDVSPIPEPATMLLFGTGIAGLVGSRLRRKKK